jgi:polyketide cyclase/dehydrase/lipid transport protein
MRRIVPIFAGIAALLITILLVGVVLPNSWEADQTVELPHSPAVLYPLLADLAQWDRWTVWSEFESDISTPSEGVGATRTWDDPEYGGGTIRLTEAIPDARIGYHVALDGGARVDGAIVLAEQEDGGTAVTWTESGDFGWNPLMGFMARRMPESQKAQMLASLTRLGEAAAAGDR